MNDPAAARTEPAQSGRATDRGRTGPGLWASAASLARALFVAASLVTAYYLLPLNGGSTSGASALFACGLLAVVVVFSWEIRAIVRSPHPRLKAVEALGATLALYLVLFASAYYLLEHAVPGSFSEPLTKTDALYFTLTTFTTVGFGDITARSETGRVVTMLQMTGGLLLVGVAARVLSNAIRAGLLRQGREPPAE
ncbi:potassium channel family protein [Streptomyces sp. NBC_00996]|uniref:potassium channel family protein n=1 Tax=Streptomyces sp. NBC_00996 TaxID=2903710 RepID=UPI0038679D21|nr:potassium channel family protein [Streptomyces sp. NBC_00996]